MHVHLHRVALFIKKSGGREKEAATTQNTDIKDAANKILKKACTNDASDEEVLTASVTPNRRMTGTGPTVEPGIPGSGGPVT